MWPCSVTNVFNMQRLDSPLLIPQMESQNGIHIGMGIAWVFKLH